MKPAGYNLWMSHVDQQLEICSCHSFQNTFSHLQLKHRKQTNQLKRNQTICFGSLDSNSGSIWTSSGKQLRMKTATIWALPMCHSQILLKYLTINFLNTPLQHFCWGSSCKRFVIHSFFRKKCSNLEFFWSKCCLLNN